VRRQQVLGTWGARLQQAASSSSPVRYSPYSTPSPRYLTATKDKHKDLPRRRTSGDVVIRDRRTPSPTRGSLHLIKPKRGAKEWTLPSDYKTDVLQMKVEEDPEEF
jgi:hypothetical protein